MKQSSPTVRLNTTSCPRAPSQGQLYYTIRIRMCILRGTQRIRGCSNEPGLGNTPSLPPRRQGKEAGPRLDWQPSSLLSAPLVLVPALRSEVPGTSKRTSPVSRLGPRNKWNSKEYNCFRLEMFSKKVSNRSSCQLQLNSFKACHIFLCTRADLSHRPIKF